MNVTKNAVLKVKGLDKHYGDLHAVKELDFTVHRGEIFGILGPNGSGKTTTLECILGTRTTDSGDVSILGMNPRENRRELYTKVGVQFQDSAWQPSIKVEELCEMTASLYAYENDWIGMLEDFDLYTLRKSSAESLSGGEKQKLSILLACIHNPELVFLDELTSGLDPLARRASWAFIQDLQRKGCTVVLTSHFMDEVEHLCNRGMILKAGRKIAEGSIQELKQTGRRSNHGDEHLPIPGLEEAYINLVGGEA